MVTFITLFLGLVVGTHPVEMAVSGPVTAVELRLDGETMGTARAEPWIIDCDFGEDLAPHELVAVAFDADGEEIGRARQWVNLPRSRAEAGLTLEQEPDGRRLVRVSWQTMEGRDLRSVGVTFDGEPLAAAGPDRFILPPFNPAEVHLLVADVELEGGLAARAEAAVGGRSGSTVAIEMTAVPLVRKRIGRTPSPEELSGLLVQGDAPLTVAATEAGGGDIVVVRTPDALPGLGALGLGTDTRVQTTIRLEEGELVRFLSPVASRLAEPGLPYDLFPLSEPYREGQLDHLLARVSFGADRGTPRISDALAAAGVEAAAGHRPRLVLLVLGEDDEDASRFSPAEALGYLERLRVSLVVWSTAMLGAARVSEDRTPMSAPTPWGTARVISSENRYLRSLADLRRILGSQFIAWVEGGHLPQSITPAPGARGLEPVH